MASEMIQLLVFDLNDFSSKRGNKLTVMADEYQNISSAMFKDSMDSMSKWLVGSSIISTLGSCMIILPNSKGVFSPPEQTFALFLMSSEDNNIRPKMPRAIKGVRPL